MSHQLQYEPLEGTQSTVLGGMRPTMNWAWGHGSTLTYKTPGQQSALHVYCQPAPIQSAEHCPEFPHTDHRAISATPCHHNRPLLPLTPSQSSVPQVCRVTSIMTHSSLHSDSDQEVPRSVTEEDQRDEEGSGTAELSANNAHIAGA